MTKEKLHEIKKNLFNDGRTPTSWARINGFNAMTLLAILRGHYNLNSNMAQTIFARLRKDGYLIDEDRAA